MNNDCKKCIKWDWQEEKFCIEGLFEIEGDPKTSGNSLFPFGFAVKLLEPRSELFVDFGEGATNIQFAGGGTKLIFNHLYGKGDYDVCIIARKPNDLRWQARHFHVHVVKKIYPPGSIITGFFWSKSMGQFESGATGLDVAFSLSLGGGVKTIQWYFEKDANGNLIEDMAMRNDTSAHHTYKKIGDFQGKVVVTDHQNNHAEETFQVSVTGIS